MIILKLIPDGKGETPINTSVAGTELSRNGCPILRRISAHIIDRGVLATIEHTFRNRQGQVIDLTSLATPAAAGDGIVLRARPIGAPSTSAIVQVPGTIAVGTAGLVSAIVPEVVAANHGIYELSWGITYNANLVSVNTGLLSVERSLFGDAIGTLDMEGPPTINEIRMSLWDSDPEENSLIQDVEFGDSQIINAIVRPIQYFNETNPPIDFVATVNNFPFRGQWMEAIGGYLFETAASFYRRNYLPGNAGGVDVQDLGKEPHYAKIAGERLREWKDFVARKKIQLNMSAGFGVFGSPYDD